MDQVTKLHILLMCFMHNLQDILMHVACLLHHSSKAMPACSITAACTCEENSLEQANAHR